MRSTRRNISITNERVELALERSENASKYVEKAILYYLDQQEKEFVELTQFEELEQEIQKQKELLVTLSKAVLGR